MKRVFFILVVAAVCMQFAVAQKPNSKFAGVQIGTITYSYRSMPDQSLEATLNYIVQSGINSVELLADVVEKYAGIPENRNKVSEWRKTVSMDKFKEIKKMFNKHGVKIHILNIDASRWADEEIDYAFRICKTLGAKGIVMEISEEAIKRISPFADKHKLYAIFHNHGQPENPDFSFDKLLTYGSRLMLSFDVGHYYSATGQNPCDLIKRLHHRIANLHLKDKTWEGSYAQSRNLPFGEGQTPLVEILQLIQKEKWPIVCHIEQEYRISQESNAVKEVINCVEFCRKALVK